MGKLKHALIDEMSQPKSGEVMLNKYWCVHPEKGLAYWDRGGRSFSVERYSPQCNSSKAVSDRLVSMHEGHVVEQIPAVYVSNLRAALAE